MKLNPKHIHTLYVYGKKYTNIQIFYPDQLLQEKNQFAKNKILYFG